jgi:hypothetical protein
MGIFDRAKDLLSQDTTADADPDRAAGLDSGESAAPDDPIDESEPASTDPGEPAPEA